MAFVSQRLEVSETRYPIQKLEFLALKWAVMAKFRDYLYGAKFEVWTDNPLTYVLISAKLDATGQWWVFALGEYEFSIHCHAGRHNVDALSWWPSGSKAEVISVDGVRGICNYSGMGHCPRVLHQTALQECWVFPLRVCLRCLFTTWCYIPSIGDVKKGK